MKHFGTTLSLMAFVLLLISCGEKKNNPTSTSTSTKKESTSIVTLANIGLTSTPVDSNDFKVWKRKWETDGVSYMNGPALPSGLARMTYFDVPKDDLTALLALNPSHTRFYLGLKTVPVSNEVPTGLKPHLFLIGTDANGVLDMSHIYDYTSACPPDCTK